MIDAGEAIALAHRFFPDGPENLAAHLGVEIRESPLVGCDGWCLPRHRSALIRLNNKLAKTRKRFTLAHELGHLILDIPTVADETVEEMLSSDSAEERRVNEFASNLLIPPREITRSIKEPPVIAKSLGRLAKRANVSPVMVAVRVTNLAHEVGLDNAAVVHFQDGEIRWRWSPVLSFKPEAAISLLADAKEAAPNAYRRQQHDGKVVVASTIENPYLGSTTLFIQLLTAAKGFAKASEERRRELEEQLFPPGSKLRPQLQGCFGHMKPKVASLSIDEAVAAFWDRYHERFKDSSLNSEAGRDYVRLRLEAWCQ